MFGVTNIISNNLRKNYLSRISCFTFAKKLPDKWIWNTLHAERRKSQHIWRILCGDEVIVTNGAFKGKIGRVIKVLRKKQQVLVQGINLKEEKDELGFNEEDQVKRFIEQPIPYHYVGLYDRVTNKAVRVQYSKDEYGNRIRKVVSTGEVYPEPDRGDTSFESRNKNRPTGPKDTEPNVAHEKTFVEYDFVDVAKQFLQKIKEKEAIEKNLILRDK